MTPSFKQILDVIIDGARTMVDSFGGVATHAIMDSSGGDLMYLPGMDVDKRVYAAVIAAAAKSCGATRVFLISESWVVSGQAEIDCPPSEHPDRKEVLMVAWTTADRQDGLATIPIVRDASGKPTVAGEVKMASGGANVFLDAVFAPPSSKLH